MTKRKIGRLLKNDVAGSFKYAAWIAIVGIGVGLVMTTAVDVFTGHIVKPLAIVGGFYALSLTAKFIGGKLA